MYFKRLDIQGFKSFAEPVSIEFNNGVTCIVGPNGSGKSNISDAIRWVLGEQSPKALRGGKMDEVIFAGTANRKSRGMAEVTLTIDNSDGILPIDYNEVAITRRLYRSGEGEYFINNNHCRLKDIRELIMDTGIGVDGYSLIGQGKIADIVANKTESRREIFEEAAGIVMYRTKKAEAEKKLDNSKQSLERVNDIISELEGRIDGLRADSIKAKEYIELRDRQKELEINITLRNIEALELKNEYLKDDINEITAQIEDLKEDKQEIDRLVAENRRRSENLEEIYGDANRKLVASIEEINALVNQSQVNNERLSAINDNTRRLDEELAAIGNKLEKERANADELLKAKAFMDKKLETLDAVLKEKIAAHAEKMAESAERAAEIEAMKNDIFGLHNAITAKNGEINSLKALKDNLLRRKETIGREEAGFADDHERVTNAKAEAEKQLAELSGSVEAAKALEAEMKRAYGEMLAEEKNLSVELEETKLTIGQKTARKKTIEEMESNYEGYNGAVKFVMRSGFEGIHGVVADLITVPKGYEIAIETALGAAMQNVVCRSDRDAQRVITVLKENRAGRLTFLPVESIKGRGGRPAALDKSSGFLGYGTECIEYDAKYEGIFEYLLGRVAVVDNMQNAVRLSKQNGSGLRFVTLEGEIINASGAITGGKFKNNTANLLERKAEITRLSEELAALEQKRESCTERLSQLRVKINEGAAGAEKQGAAVRGLELELISAKNRLEVLQRAMNDAQQDREKLARELTDIQRERAAADEMIEKLQAEAEAARDEITALEQKTEEAITHQEESRAEIEDCSEEITRARIDVTACEGEKTSVDAMVARITSDIELLEADRETKERQKEELDRQKQSLSGGTMDVVSVVREKEEARAALERYIAEISEEKAAVATGLSADSARKDEIDESVTNLQNRKFEMELKRGRNETQLENHKEKLLNDFEVSYFQAMEFKKREFNMNAATSEVRRIRARMSELGDVNIGAIKEYEDVSGRYEGLVTYRSDILTATDDLTKIIEDMDRTITAKFKESFDAVVTNFESIFRELFGGGHAELRLDDPNDPLESGIDIIAQPPGKKLQNINLLSGGEKTMTAIALMFAVLKTKPTPFCILDEVEAALDDANIDRFANYLKKFEGIQFALVTHQRTTMEHADVLYGVTMPEQGVTKVISLRLGDEFNLDE